MRLIRATHKNLLGVLLTWVFIFLLSSPDMITLLDTNHWNGMIFNLLMDSNLTLPTGLPPTCLTSSLGCVSL